jgi:Arc/MetJ-type ribon-helix-helix transcriptional regulator
MAITESRILPPEFIEAAQKTYLTDLTRQAGIPSITTAVQQQPGETAQQFAQRQAQAQQFGITKAGMAELAPQVAAQDPLQAAAYAQAVDPTKGLGAYQPFLTKAGTAADAATGLTGTGAGTGVGSISSYMSPYQSQVIDTTLSEFDKQRQIQANQQAAAALGTPGAFGGGREGVMRAEYQSASDLNRAKILADLQQRGFQQAQQSRQQDLANQMGISELQTGLGARAQDFSRAQISGLGTLGAAQQAQNQAVLDAQRQASAMAVQDPRDRLARFGQGITGLTPGAGTVQVDPQAATAPGASPLAQALGIGLAGADIYGRIFK